MEQLVGSNIQVVLSLKEGKGFDRIANPTCIVATLNGHSLETDSTEPASDPQFITDLMWKADKNGLRKMRTGQEPLKIECFEIKEHGKREKIGYVILSLRQARIVVPRDGDVHIPATWHKLLGLRNDMKIHKPELSLALTIEEHETYVRRITKQQEIKERTQSNFQVAPSKDPLVPYLVEEECLIQLGPASTCRTLFLLNITAGAAQNLHFLKGETDEKSTKNFSLWYRILENDIRLKSFASLEKRWILNEKLVIRIRSSLSILKNYLSEHPNFLLLLQYKDTILGYSEVDLRSLIPAELSEDKLREENGGMFLNNRCIFVTPKTPNSVDENEENRAFVDLQLRLYCVGTKKLPNEGIADTAKIYEANSNAQPWMEYPRDDEQNVQNVFSEIDAHRNPCGDSGVCVSGDRRIISCNNYQNRYQKNRGHLTGNFIVTDNSCNEENLSKSIEAYHCYCLNVNLIGIKLSSSIENIEFRFHHPKAEIMSTLYPKMPILRDDKLRLQDIGCKLHFISAADEIRHLLLSFPPKFSVCDAANESKAIIGQTILNVALLFHQNKLESKYEALLYDGDKSVIGVVDVAMSLEDHGPYYKTYKRTSGENLGPPIIDDSLAYKIVEELESWKDRQQEIFRVELKRKEERHLNRLSEEWQIRRENLESKLACSVEQCKMLANNLNKATEDLRTRRLKSLEKEARLIKANEDLQWRYENNLRELQEASRKMQEELVTKVNLLEEVKKNLEAQFEPLRLENEELRRLTSKQAEDLETYQKSSLTQDQTASLLQDVKGLEQKLANTQASKSFFKEEWGKAVREIHRMKKEHQQAIEVQIKTSKEELKNIDLEDMLCADSNALSNDQLLLGQIQKEIDVIKPRSSFLHKDTASQQIFRTIDPSYVQHSAKSNRGSAKTEEQDERLRNLLEERNTLLKTGSYAIDDAIIVKLDTEIRPLLFSN